MPPLWDVFLSHGSPDKPWVESLAAELQALGLRPFLDVGEITPGDSFPHVLSQGLADSRFLVLILSPHSSRPWVDLEWGLPVDIPRSRSSPLTFWSADRLLDRAN